MEFPQHITDFLTAIKEQYVAITTNVESLAEMVLDIRSRVIRIENQICQRPASTPSSHRSNEPPLAVDDSFHSDLSSNSKSDRHSINSSSAATTATPQYASGKEGNIIPSSQLCMHFRLQSIH